MLNVKSEISHGISIVTIHSVVNNKKKQKKNMTESIVIGILCAERHVQCAIVVKIMNTKHLHLMKFFN